MDRNAAIRARSNIKTYFDPSPSEQCLKNFEPAFDRAKARWLKVMHDAIAEVEQMQFSDYMEMRSHSISNSRKPDECPECGQSFKP